MSLAFSSSGIFVRAFNEFLKFVQTTPQTLTNTISIKHNMIDK
jgi:hypothetical protein